MHFVQNAHATHAMLPATARDIAVPILPATAALPAVAIEPATAVLATVAAELTTPALATVAADPATAVLATVAAEPATAELAVVDTDPATALLTVATSESTMLTMLLSRAGVSTTVFILSQGRLVVSWSVSEDQSRAIVSPRSTHGKGPAPHAGVRPFLSRFVTTRRGGCHASATVRARTRTGRPRCRRALRLPAHASGTA
jgi:hypothetical protein